MITSTRVLLALAITTCVGSPQSVGGQPPAGEIEREAETADGLAFTHELEVGEYRSFGALSWIRLSTDVFLDPTEAKSADVRCFYGLDRLNDGQKEHAFGRIAAGDMALSSRLETRYYVVEPVEIPSAPSFAGQAATVVGPFPDSWDIPANQVDRLERVIDMAGRQAALNWNETYYREHVLRDGNLLPSLGVVTSDPRAFSDLSCKQIVNWTGARETVGHAGMWLAGSR